MGTMEHEQLAHCTSPCYSGDGSAGPRSPEGHARSTTLYTSDETRRDAGKQNGRVWPAGVVATCACGSCGADGSGVMRVVEGLKSEAWGEY
jgi:hypothetical protein